MRTITTQKTLYQFDELSDAAKEKARDWYREGVFDYDWWDFFYEDAENIGLKIEGFDINRRTIGGHLINSVGATCALIIANHGASCDTYKLAQCVYRYKNDPMTKPMRKEDFEYALLQEYLSMLTKEAEHLQSAEAIDENIQANEYEFTIDGKREVI